MFFEGAEKKLEIILKNKTGSLLSIDQEVWDKAVRLCEASILSMIENDHVKAFLLSESSLFVWKDRLLMLTCGETKLVQSAHYLMDIINKEDIAAVTFQRKNEYRSHLQSTHFDDDVKLLREQTEGTALRFGQLHGHHNLLFHTNQTMPEDDDKTIELLMYDMREEVSKRLTQENLSSQDIRSFLGIEEAFPGFIVDDFSFKPYGYSLNAIKDHLYFTIHVTPQETSPYVSFETNMPLSTDGFVLKHFINKLKPESFDVMTFNCEVQSPSEDYLTICEQKERLKNGFDVCFKTYQAKHHRKTRPTVILKG